MLLKPKYWEEYKLLKIGDGIKVEKFANKVIIRPELESRLKNNSEIKKYQETIKILKQQKSDMASLKKQNSDILRVL